MDWNNIKKKYPKSLEKLHAFFHNKFERSNPRMLFDFFDNEAIYIEIGAPIGDTPRWACWDYDIAYPIIDQQEYYRESEYGFKNRLEAEESAFIEAFSQLEKQLKRK